MSCPKPTLSMFVTPLIFRMKSRRPAFKCPTMASSRSRCKAVKGPDISTKRPRVSNGVISIRGLGAKSIILLLSAEQNGFYKSSAIAVRGRIKPSGVEAHREDRADSRATPEVLVQTDGASSFGVQTWNRHLREIGSNLCVYYRRVTGALRLRAVAG